MQLHFQLDQVVTNEQVHSLVCIPDRSTAEYELYNLKRDYGERLLKAKIRKDRVGKGSTYTLRYVTRETEMVRLF